MGKAQEEKQTPKSLIKVLPINRKFPGAIVLALGNYFSLVAGVSFSLHKRTCESKNRSLYYRPNLANARLYSSSLAQLPTRMLAFWSAV